MKLFQRSLLHYVFWVSILYFSVGMYNIFIYKFTDTIFIQMVWYFILSIPIWSKKLARFLNTH